MSTFETQRDTDQPDHNKTIDYWWSKMSSRVHTQLPAKVVKVDNIKNSVTVQPLISTYINNTQTLSFPECEVPMSLMSTGRGGAKITLPSNQLVGSAGLLHFSERDPTNWLLGVGDEEVKPLSKDNLSMGASLYPISFEVGLFTPASAIEWDSENIVIQQGKHNIKIPLLDDKPILLNGLQVPLSGNVITKATTDLDQLKSDHDQLKLDYDQLKSDFEVLKLAYESHFHLAPVGGGNTGTPLTP